MTKNVTIRLDEAILKKCRHRAIEDDKSLSRWITDVLVKVVSEKEQYEAARERALQRMERGFQLGGKPLCRDEIHER
jgi:predicted transcriptional regulator